MLYGWVLSLMAAASMRDARVNTPQRGGFNWLHVEADHFLAILKKMGISSFAEWDQVAKDLGEKYLDDNLVSLLSRHAASCSEAIPPNELASSWRGVLSSRSKAAMLVRLLKQREPAGSSAAQAELQFAAAAVQRVSAEKKAMPPPWCAVGCSDSSN